MKRLAFAAACAAAGVLLAACSSSGQPANKNNSTFTYLLDRTGGNWTENRLVSLPPLPSGNALLAFDVSNTTPLTFAVDPNSLSVGSDGVVRYTVVVTSPSGARNVNYEGIHCATYEWRLYATMNASHDGWDQTVANDWAGIEGGSNGYQASLYQDYFCSDKMPATTKPATIVNHLREHKTLMMLEDAH
ncbi:hypothetical protein CY652_14660 [Burkholderia sp. WAC0059]|nr:hypothetical protein CY652_14660 [Burkholderia sp. WAC0059]